MKCLGRTRGSSRSLYTEKGKMKVPVELKGQTVPQEERAASSEPVAPAISRHTGEHLRGPHNKENCREKRCSAGVQSDDEVALCSSSLAEDSGYLSLHNSQLEHADLETVEKCPELRDSTVSSDTHSDSSSSCLPVLKFQEEVCRALAESYRKSQSYDWTVINKVAENYSLHNVIGGKMGLEHVDILCGLMKKDMKHILTRILGLLGECDLISCRKVSRTWRKIICQDERALQRCRKAEKTLRESGRSMGSLSRDFGLSRVVFSCLQTVASSTPVQKHTKKALTHTDGTLATPKPSRFAEFYEATKSLKCHEALRSCRLCGSPARYDSAMQRAVCTRGSCAFDFCSQCQSDYHGSTPCQRTKIRSSSRSQTVLVACSTRSKRNIRRL
ncbi:F-box only protein 5 [Salminus brasiliensis]|uniref:F-box only protein 5 n=1 Tax=Salminus brasiliensis TaxID=930266 RepID=UPI003B837CF9